MLKALAMMLAVLMGSTSIAQTIVTNVKEQSDTPFRMVNWITKDSNDEVTIHNGTGKPIMVEITVSNVGYDPSGITITNCGNTTTIEAGSSAVCTNSDDNNPITFSSESATYPAAGTYQIRKAD